MNNKVCEQYWGRIHKTFTNVVCCELFPKIMTKVCHKHGLDQPSSTNKQNTHEFLINKEHGLIWCNVFKAASSSWFWNFNLLAGYTEEQLLEGIQQPLVLARRMYPRPDPEAVRTARLAQPAPITFMIARHPFHRLVSGFRDKMLNNDKGYQFVKRDIMESYPEPAGKHPQNWISPLIRSKPTPSFAQFVQYIINQHTNNRSSDIHWRPMNDLCSPCLNHFDTIAMIETLKEDASYIIFRSGIQDMIQPKIINQTPGKRTKEVAQDLLCQLSQQQILDLSNIYKLDLELFQYNINDYISCTANTNKPNIT